MGLCAVAQAMVTFQLIGCRPIYPLLFLLFGATICVYNFSIYIDKPTVIQSTSVQRINWFLTHKKLMKAGIIASTIMVVTMVFFLSDKTWLILGGLALLAFGYSLPMFQKGNYKFGLRNITGLKAILIALVWTLSCVGIPVIEAQNRHLIEISGINLFVLITKRFLFFAALTIPFDIRDFLHDRALGLKTIPVILGVKNAYLLCGALLTIYMLLLLFCRNNGFSVGFSALICTAIITAWLIFKPGIKKTEYYYFCIDGVLILQYLAVLAFKLI